MRGRPLKPESQLSPSGLKHHKIKERKMQRAQQENYDRELRIKQKQRFQKERENMQEQLTEQQEQLAEQQHQLIEQQRQLAEQQEQLVEQQEQIAEQQHQLTEREKELSKVMFSHDQLLREKMELLLALEQKNFDAFNNVILLTQKRGLLLRLNELKRQGNDDENKIEQLESIIDKLQSSNASNNIWKMRYDMEKNAREQAEDELQRALYLLDKQNIDRLQQLWTNPSYHVDNPMCDIW